MESLSAENVKRIAGFLNFKDMVSFSQIRQSFQADLKPLIRKAEVAMMKGDGKINKVVTTLTRALIQIEHVAFDDDLEDDYCRDWVKEMLRCISGHFNFMGLQRLQMRDRIAPFHGSVNLHRLRNPIPLACFLGRPADNEVIIQHFLNEMD